MSSDREKRLVIVLGPTAVGKTDYSIELALEAGSPVISCDSRQLYREMQIGTAPPSREQLEKVHHYFIASHSVTDPFSAGRYEVEALALVEELFKTHDTLVMAGGSGLYIDAFCNGLDNFPDIDPSVRASLLERLEKEGLASLRFDLSRLDPATAETVDPANWQRIVRALEVCIGTSRPFSSYKTGPRASRPFVIEKIGLERDREELYRRISDRTDEMMRQGLEEEARRLAPLRHLTPLQTVGYREMFDYFDGKTTQEEAVRLIKRNTRRYARKQMTWWRKDPDIKWMEAPASL